MFSQAEYRVQAHDQENYYSFKDQLDIDAGFMLAAAVTAYDGNSEDITDPSIGRLKFVKKTWDGSDAENGNLRFTEILT